MWRSRSFRLQRSDLADVGHRLDVKLQNLGERVRLGRRDALNLANRSVDRHGHFDPRRMFLADTKTKRADEIFRASNAAYT